MCFVRTRCRAVDRINRDVVQHRRPRPDGALGGGHAAAPIHSATAAAAQFDGARHHAVQLRAMPPPPASGNGRLLSGPGKHDPAKRSPPPGPPRPLVFHHRTTAAGLGTGQGAGPCLCRRAGVQAIEERMGTGISRSRWLAAMSGWVNQPFRSISQRYLCP